MANRITEDETRAILATLESGVSVGKAAKKHNRSKGAVSGIAKRNGLNLERSHTKKATEARREYAEAERLALSDELFEKLRMMATQTADSGEFRDLVVSYGILTDKRRLETGEVTDRREQHNIHDRERHFDRLFSQLDAERARANGDGSPDSP